MTDFISTWRIPVGGATIKLPIINGTILPAFTITWGDGTNLTSSGYTVDNDQPQHTYTNNTASVITVTITITVPTGKFGGWSFSNVPQSKDNILSISNYGRLELSTGAFYECSNLTSIPNNIFPLPVDSSSLFYDCTWLNCDLNNLDTSAVTNMQNMFFGCTSFNGNISGWDVSLVTNMSSMFEGCTIFNCDLSGWDVSQVTNMSSMFKNSAFNSNLSGWALTVTSVNDMSSMFEGCTAFNGNNLSAWSVFNVTNMSGMFKNSAFNSNLSGWNVSKVTNMSSMFEDCNSFTNDNNSLSNWVVSSVTNMSSMFEGCNYFDGNNLSNWVVSSVTNMSGMFKNSAAFNSDLSAWNNRVNNVTNMSSMFEGCNSFNGNNISGWNVSSVTNMSSMFEGCDSFIGNLSGWNDRVNNVTNMSSMFKGCTAFNGNNLSGWNVSSVTNMSGMFQSSAFNSINGNLSLWNVSNVTNMSRMFQGCTAFNGNNLSGWNVSKVTNMINMFNGCSSFNANIAGWNVSNVTDMTSMFNGCLQFNSNISGWNVSNVTNMSHMFFLCSSFNSNIAGWNVSNVTDMFNMFNGCTGFLQDLSSWILSSLTNNSNAPSFTHNYITTVNPRFSTDNQEAWNFTKNLNITDAVFHTILPPASRQLYTMTNKRLVLSENKNTFIVQTVAAGATLAGTYELANVTDIVLDKTLNNNDAKFVHVWVTGTQSAELRIYYADDIDGQNEVFEFYDLTAGKLSTVNSIVKKPYVRIEVINHSSVSQTITVRTRFDNVSAEPHLEIKANDITMNINHTFENLNTLRNSISFSGSSVQLYGTATDITPTLTDDSGKLIVKTYNPLGVTGPVSITGPISISGPLSITGTTIVSGTVGVTGNVKCNINADQVINISGTMQVQGTSTITIDQGQFIGISGPITVNNVVDCSLTNITFGNGTPVNIIGSVNCNINSEQNIGISGEFYTTLNRIKDSLIILKNRLDISANSIIQISTVNPTDTTFRNVEGYGLDCIFCYSDDQPNLSGNIEIFYQYTANFNTASARLGTLKPIIKYSTTGQPIGRWGSISLDLTGVGSLAIKNTSAAPIVCKVSLYSNNPLGVL